MSGSWRIGTISGIGVYVHWTFLILLAWVGFEYFTRGGGLTGALVGILTIGALFTIIVLHELGHALAARRYGIPTHDITLLPIGGVARLARMPEGPKQELIVAIAGPAVNVVLAGLCLLGIIVLVAPAYIGAAFTAGAEEIGLHFAEQGQTPLLSGIPFLIAAFLFSMLIVNVMLVVFNLLPAFPMDGGRVLRALLAMRGDYVWATQTAATVGQVMALLFGFFGLFNQHFMLVFIALFVWIGAASEASMVQVKAGLQGVPLVHAMITRFHVLAPMDRIGDAAMHIVAGFQHDFPVLENGRLVGVLTKTDLLKSLADNGGNQLVSDVMQRKFETADPGDMLESVFSRLQECDCHTIPVVRNDQLFGIVTMESVGEFMAIQKAARGRKK